jgi:hypothetical protein
MLILVRAAVVAIAMGAASAPAVASPPVPQPQLDLGQTSFLDGEAGRGGLLEVIVNGLAADRFTDRRGNDLPGTHELQTGSVTFHPAYVSPISFAGGHLGIEGLFPVAVAHQQIVERGATKGGVGDITIAPFVQWSGLSLFGRPLSARLAMQVVAPTGSYTSRSAINFGQNAWQVSPYLALTWHATQRWEISSRLIYDWSSRNGAPEEAFGARSIQAGDQANINLSASRAVGGGWRLGVSGYTFQQLSDSSIGRAEVAGSRQRAFGVGPGLLWSHGRMTLIATAYREFATENHPRGGQVVVRLLRPL